MYLLIYLLVGEGQDIVDEAITYFRANVLFKNYEFLGDADKLLMYLTLCITQALVKVLFILFFFFVLF
jgi:hypothetical protein